MTDPTFALQRAIHAALTSDGALTTRLGGPKVYDHVPREARHPYLSFGASVLRDWSTGTEAGSEHVVSITVWSRGAGRREALELASLVRTRLHDADIAISGHRLVQLRHELTETRRESDGETVRVLLRFRSTTEPQP